MMNILLNRLCVGGRHGENRLTQKLDQGNHRFFTLFLVLEMYFCPLPSVGVIFKDAALREQCVVETIWMVYMNESIKASI